MIKRLLFIFLLISFFTGNCFSADPASWDLLDEDCSDISDWTDEDSINGISEVSPAGQFRFYNTAGGNPENSIAQRVRDIGTYPDTYTVEFKTYFTTLGGDPGVGFDYFMIRFQSDDVQLNIQCRTTGFFINDGSVYNEVGTNLVQTGALQTWRVLATMTTPASATCDVYLGDVLQASGFDCSATGAFTDGTTRMWMYGYDLATDMNSDWIKIATGLFTPGGAKVIWWGIPEE